MPTGTVTAAPVSTTSMPRERPSVVPRAMARTLSAAEVLLHFAGEVDLDAAGFGVDGDGVVDGGELVFGKFGVEGGPDDL